MQAPQDPMEDPNEDEETLSSEESEGPEETGKKGKGPSPAQLLVEIATQDYRLVRSTDARTYAVPNRGGTALSLSSKKGLRAQLAKSLHRRTGIVPSGSALTDCLTILEGEAAELPAQEVYLRMARADGDIVLDLGTTTGHCVRITGRGWSIEGTSPVVFRRTDLILPFVEPVQGGTLDPLQALINLTEPEFHLAIGWMICAYFVDYAHPILVLQGEQGTAKSTLMRMLIALVDPQPAAERSLPSDKREWGIFGRASWALGFDNVTTIPDEMSNALCKGATGEAVFQRELHSDEDIILFAFRRVLALNTIALKHEMANDFADRILLLEPEVITERLSEEEILRRQAAALPEAFGAILGLVSAVLRHLPEVKVPNPPRMADFARVLAALDAATGWSTLPDYLVKVAQTGMNQIEGDTLARTLYFLAQRATGNTDPLAWEGTSGELIGELRGIVAVHELPAADIPADARVLGRRLREIAPSLRKVGVDVRQHRTKTKRTVSVIKLAERVENSTASSSSEKEGS